jgi:hypothetical protein
VVKAGVVESDYFIFGKAGRVDQDPIVQKVLDRIQTRSEIGLKKYGVTMMRDDVSTVEWLRHAQEEALDFAVYIERVIHDLESK